MNTFPTTPFSGQQAGTSGLRAKTQIFMQDGYLQNYVQCCLDVLQTQADFDKTKPILLGGDGRYFNDEALQISAEIAVGNGFSHLIFAKSGLLSTPAGSYLVKKLGASACFLLSASHNPGGADGDFGVKLNVASGAPAPLTMTEAICAKTQAISEYHRTELSKIDLTEIGQTQSDGVTIDIIDAPILYADFMQSLFDFTAIRAYLAHSPLLFDAMHAVTGVYARELFVNRLGVATDNVLNATPLPDFGGEHPDPSPTTASHLVDAAFAESCPYALIAASDGDGDRNMIMGKGVFVSPSDSLAVIAANTECLPQFGQACIGAARSMPTSRAVDAVAQQQGFDCYETPTGWKFFGNLLDAGNIVLCGEESFGTGASHVREKDGLWAILAWLNILAVKQCSVEALMHAHWQTYGRHYYCRYDYEGLPNEEGEAVFAALTKKLTQPIVFDGIVGEGSIFRYHDLIDGSVADNQGWQFIFGDVARFVVRKSGTGTSGVTVRLYLERFSHDFQQELATFIEPLAALAVDTLDVHTLTGLIAPTNII